MPLAQEKLQLTVPLPMLASIAVVSQHDDLAAVFLSTVNAPQLTALPRPDTHNFIILAYVTAVHHGHLRRRLPAVSGSRHPQASRASASAEIVVIVDRGSSKKAGPDIELDLMLEVLNRATRLAMVFTGVVFDTTDTPPIAGDDAS